MAESSTQENVGEDNVASVVVLVTGGCGYVGTHTVVRLLEQNVQVVVVDNVAWTTEGTEDSKPKSLQRVEELTGKAVAFHNIDISNGDALEKIFDSYRFDCVIHLAALKSVGDSCRLPLDYYRNNVAGTVTLLEVMKSHQVKKLVFSSSATVYGEPQYLPINEEHVTGQKVTNPYGRTKYFIEEILRDLCTSDPEWSAICLRYFNPVGAHPSGRIGEDPAGVPCNLMPYVAQVAVGRRPKLAVYGNDYPTPDGTGIRDYIHIMDLAEGHWAATKKILQNGSKGSWLAYNLGLGRGYSVLDVVKCFESVSGRSIAVDFVCRRDGDVASSYSDCSLASSQLDWKASRTLTDMCTDMWRWQSINPNGYQSN
ncbi:UDP-glucose 4-epimerase [Daphnia magna]|uniref:UDP-glucose 4-epimerase n=1 Tax=Daphnia magna TaxID=35525 RepID=A0A162Q0G6_9CRUS|nr:UDP-glucose 4-epimerase [Daphnia magna]